MGELVNRRVTTAAGAGGRRGHHRAQRLPGRRRGCRARRRQPRRRPGPLAGDGVAARRRAGGGVDVRPADRGHRGRRPWPSPSGATRWPARVLVPGRAAAPPGASCAGWTGASGGWPLLAGVLLALHFATWMPALTLTTVASATALVATQPVWAALLARPRGERGRPAGLARHRASRCPAPLLLDRGRPRGQRAGAARRRASRWSAGRSPPATWPPAARCGAASRRRRTRLSATRSTALLLLVVCLVGRQSLGGYDGDDWVQLARADRRRPAARALAVQPGPARGRARRSVSLSILFEIPGAALIAAVFLGQRPPLLALPAAGLLVAGLALVIRAGAAGRAAPARGVTSGPE